ncbi:MAG: HNH endonuclease [Candidatus Helarchaeota archaeon]
MKKQYNMVSNIEKSGFKKIQCEICNKVIYVRNSYFTNRNRRFCSKECRNNYFARFPKIKNCLVCQTEFKDRSGGTRKYCSLKCYWKNLKIIHQTAGHNFKKEKVIIRCKFCNNNISLLPSRAKKRKFCSQSCASKWKIKMGIIKTPKGFGIKSRFKKGNTPPFKGKKMLIESKIKMRNAKLKNPTRYWLGKKRLKMRKAIKSEWCEYRRQLRERTEYKLWRRAVFNRDNYTCILCGKKDKTIQADHIIPARLRGDLILNVKNGQTLCKECHRKKTRIDMKKIKAIKY